uniref:Uncharacterized protein n=1 Tax=Romanomermis culicivorax TaxID=13658 RepID=A0A915JGH9_ROMCU
MPGGGTCVAIKEGRSEGNPVGRNGIGGSKFHRAEKSCRQQGHGTVGFPMVLKIDSLDVGDFRRLFKQ